MRSVAIHTLAKADDSRNAFPRIPQPAASILQDACGTDGWCVVRVNNGELSLEYDQATEGNTQVPWVPHYLLILWYS